MPVTSINIYLNACKDETKIFNYLSHVGLHNHFPISEQSFYLYPGIIYLNQTKKAAQSLQAKFNYLTHARFRNNCTSSKERYYLYSRIIYLN